MLKRVFFDIALFVSALIFPWWVGALFAVVGIFLFKNFYEYLAYCVVVYTLYSVPSDRMIASLLYSSLFTVSSFVLLSLFKENIIFYKK